jgi:hypothetical protein
MSVPVDPQSLLASANCYLCYQDEPLLKLGLLRQILLALSPMADTSPQTLLANAKCYLCFGNSDSQLRAMELSLLAQIAQNPGGGSGTGDVFRVISPLDPTSLGNVQGPAICYDDIGNFWIKDNATNDALGWTKIITAQAASIQPLAMPAEFRRDSRIDTITVPPMPVPELVPVEVHQKVIGKRTVLTWGVIVTLAILGWLLGIFAPVKAHGQFPPPFVHNYWDTNLNPVLSVAFPGAITNGQSGVGLPNFSVTNTAFMYVSSGLFSPVWNFFLFDGSSQQFSLDSDLKFHFSGTNVAPAFEGNGSGLTGINASSLIGTVPQSAIPNPLWTNTAIIHYLWTNATSGTYGAWVPGVGLVESNAIAGTLSLLVGTNGGFHAGSWVPVGPGNIAGTNSMYIGAGLVGSSNAFQIDGTNRSMILSVNKTNNTFGSLGLAGFGTLQPESTLTAFNSAGQGIIEAAGLTGGAIRVSQGSTLGVGTIDLQITSPKAGLSRSLGNHFVYYDLITGDTVLDDVFGGSSGVKIKWNGVQEMMIGANGNAAFTQSVIATNSFASYLSNGVSSASISFPNTTVNWTNPQPYNIVLYIDNTAITGTAIKKNGQQIFSALANDATLFLKPGDYFSETYTVGTPTARYEPQ